MKILLTTLSTFVVGSMGMSSAMANINANTEPTRVEINIDLPEGNLLAGSSGYNGDDWQHFHGIWDYVTVNLGSGINPYEITGVSSTYNDSYSDHKVDALGYYQKSYDGGMHHRGQFQEVVFRPGHADPDWDITNVVTNTQQNFFSTTIPGGFDNDVTSGIRYW